MNEQQIHEASLRANAALQCGINDTFLQNVCDGLSSASDLIKQLRAENERLKAAMSICDNCSCEIEPCNARTVRVENTNAN